MTVHPLLAVVLLATVIRMAPAADGAPEFVPLFDGTTLAGWQCADPSYWSVEEGAIIGRITKEHPSARNHYLVWQGGEVGDFELRLRHRIVSDQRVNGGFQFRSRMFDGQIPADCRGYQVDNNTGTPWLVRLYDEFGRHTLALRGERAVYDATGARTVAPLPGVAKNPHFRLEDWHEYALACRGTTLALSVDGQPVAEVVDDDPKQHDLRGIFALQLHSGPPMTVQFKDIRLRRLDD